MTNRVDLYDLLPTVYRIRDAGKGYPLRALLALVEKQADVIRDDIDRLEDDLFIETCADWVVPYIGDLIANAPIYQNVQPRRADVANTIRYRRRKGTHTMLEGLAADVTGWSACVVEFFQELGWTQNANHHRPTSQWLDLRRQEACTRIGGAFDPSSRSVDVRPTTQQEGWYAVRNLGFFLFRLMSLPVTVVPARVSTSVGWGFRFDPLGARAPLFQHPRRPAAPMSELDVAGPIRRERFFVDLETAHENATSTSELYGDLANHSLNVTVDGTPIDATRIVCARLHPWPASPPSGNVVSVDVESGRLALGGSFTSANPRVDVSFLRGFPASLGGGSYPRTPTVAPTLRVVEGASPVAGDPTGPYPSVDAALTVWRTASSPNHTVIRIDDSRTYPVTGPLSVPADSSLVIEALAGQRPVLVTDRLAGLSIGSPTLAKLSVLRFDGVAIEGWLYVSGDLGKLRLDHTTIVPGRSLDDEGKPGSSAPSIVVEPTMAGQAINTHLDVEIALSIVGPLEIPHTIASLTMTDSVLDGLGGIALTDAAGTSGPITSFEQVTVFGSLRAHELFASNCIFTSRVDVDRLQGGCVRFCWVMPNATPPLRVPKRYRCQPELAVETALAAALAVDPAMTAADKAVVETQTEARIVPSFKSVHFGDPAYAQLALRTPDEVTKGADDESEMGVYHLVHQPQREANLRIRLDEYVPFGLAVGLIYVT